MGVDTFGAMRAEQRTHELTPAGIREVLHRTRAGFHRAVAGTATSVNDIVMDHVLSEPWRLDDLLTVMVGIDVVFVGVHCSMANLIERESLRGDRAVGTAVDQVANVHSHSLYDLKVDTSISSVDTCSAQIRGYLQCHPAPVERAFDRLRGVRSDETGRI